MSRYISLYRYITAALLAIYLFWNFTPQAKANAPNKPFSSVLIQEHTRFLFLLTPIRRSSWIFDCDLLRKQDLEDIGSGSATYIMILLLAIQITEPC